MSEVDRLFAAYVAEHRGGGEADPRAYLAQLEGPDRSELALLIDAYLRRSPGRQWDPDAYAGSPEERLVERLINELAPAPEGWSKLLVRLRNEAKLRRDEVVRRLAEALGLAGREERIAFYYNRMEHDQLAPEGVSQRVLGVLASILGTSTETLRRAGRLDPEAPTAGVPAFARLGSAASSEAPPAEAPAATAEQEGDEVDRLFTGGLR